MSINTFIAQNLPGTFQDLDAVVDRCVSDKDTEFKFSEGDFSGEDATYHWVRVFWEDGAGNEANLLLIPALQEALVYGYDHESSHNKFGGNEPQLVFNGLPEPFASLIDTPDFYWSWATGDERQAWATNAYWFTDGSWYYSEDWAETVEWDYDDGGSRYTLKHFLK